MRQRWCAVLVTLLLVSWFAAPARGRAKRATLPNVTILEADEAGKQNCKRVRDQRAGNGLATFAPYERGHMEVVLLSSPSRVKETMLVARFFLRATRKSRGSVDLVVWGYKTTSDEDSLATTKDRVWSVAAKRTIKGDRLRRLKGYAGWDVPFRGTGKYMRFGVETKACALRIDRLAYGPAPDVRKRFGRNADQRIERLEYKKRRRQAAAKRTEDTKTKGVKTGDLVRVVGRPPIYLVVGKSRMPVKNWAVAKEVGYQPLDVKVLSMNGAGALAVRETRIETAADFEKLLGKEFLEKLKARAAFEPKSMWQ